ncbi:SAF domain-containing protein [Brachybacterium muris]|uniref:SAF domain-containing protein n=1 Tax=Brachybacterium muris TaxID=219301 RepID=UPI00223B4D8D|nr:SAF domain-containing protein [Brachybacterium muris]MCT2260583.1 SAF domain-containing protein [Brachybacterium muris]MCT2295753.1 SAF domain-containing protein [Brachybacterium muris]
MLTRIRSQLPAYRRALRRRRRTLTALLIAMVAVAVLPSMLPAGHRGTAVVVTSRAVPAGTVITEEHVSTVEVAAELVPAGAATSADEAVGRTAAVPLTEGTPLLPGLLTSDTEAELAPGSSLLVVSAPAQLRDRLHPGTELEIHHSTSDPTRPGRTPATVVEVAGDTTGAVPGLGGTAPDLVVLVTVDRADAVEVAHATREGWSILSIVG